MAAAAARSATAAEPGLVWHPSTFIGFSANDPPPGVFSINQTFTYQANLVGPGAPAPTTRHTEIADTEALLFVPGWQFLGANYTAIIAQPFAAGTIGSPFNASANGVSNTYINPLSLSWNLGRGFFVKAGLGLHVPDGNVAGRFGTSDVGSPFWTFQPELALSYVKDGWNLSAYLHEEINTRNTTSGYTSGNLLHLDLTATRTVGKWTLGPLAYYSRQTTDDTSSAAYGFANFGKYENFAIGGLVAYEFGKVVWQVWAADEVYARAWGGSPHLPLANTTPRGWTVTSNVIFPLTGW
jgi:hypothetical protein